MTKKRKSKTYTSCEVKDRWNRQHYDAITFRVPIGAAEEVRAAAELHGMSVAAYIRHLIIADNAENPEITPFLRGGGYANTYVGQIAAEIARAARHQHHMDMMRAITDGEDPQQLPLIR